MVTGVACSLSLELGRLHVFQDSRRTQIETEKVKTSPHRPNCQSCSMVAPSAVRRPAKSS